MTTSYTYSIITDFSGNLNARQLHDIIATSSISSATFQYVETNEDVVDLWFSGTLSSADQTTLNDIVSSYTFSATTATNPPVGGFLPISLVDNKISNSTYSIVGGGYYPGTADIGAIKQIIIVAYSDKSYSLKVADVSNANTIAESTGLNNSSPVANDMGAISNLSVTGARIEVYARTSEDGSDVYINSITMML